MLVYIRGAGVTASAVAARLYHANCRIVMSDREHPHTLRRNIAFAEALRSGTTTVGGITAAAAKDPEEAVHVLRKDQIAVIADPDGNMRGTLPFDACIDTVMEEPLTDTAIDDAPIVIGIGERFRPGKNCHAAVIAHREGYRGQVRYEGSSLPEDFLGENTEKKMDHYRIKVPGGGLFYPVSEIGDVVRKDDTLAVVDSEPVVCPADGILMGILPEGDPVEPDRYGALVYTGKGRFLRDVIPEKDMAVGGGVLEALLHFRDIY